MLETLIVIMRSRSLCCQKTVRQILIQKSTVSSKRPITYNSIAVIWKGTITGTTYTYINVRFDIELEMRIYHHGIFSQSQNQCSTTHRERERERERERPTTHVD